LKRVGMSRSMLEHAMRTNLFVVQILDRGLVPLEKKEEVLLCQNRLNPGTFSLIRGHPIIYRLRFTTVLKIYSICDANFSTGIEYRNAAIKPVFIVES